MRLVVIAGKAARPGRPPPRLPVAPDLVALQGELATLRQAHTRALEARVEVLAAHVEDLEQALRTAGDRAAEWQARAEAAEAACDRARQERGLPWWRRLLGPG